MKKITAILVTLFVSLSVWAQNPKQQVIPGMSKSMEGCVSSGEVGHLSLIDGQLYCDEKGTILWVEALEYQNGSKVRAQKIKPSANGAIPQINKAFGKINTSAPVTIDNQKVQKVSKIKDYAGENGNGTDLMLDRFILERGGKVVRNYKWKNSPHTGKVYPIDFVDGRKTNTVEDKNGKDVEIKNASDYAFPTIALIDENNAEKYKDNDAIWYLNKIADVKVNDEPIVSQMMIPGPYVCTKPKVMGTFLWHEWNFWQTKTRPYVKLNEPANYCYQDLGINLPADFKINAEGDAKLAILLVLPYSEKGPDGKREDDNMAIWTSISKTDIINSDYIVLSFGENPVFSRGIIGFKVNPFMYGSPAD